jgi:hypothetical protein
MAISKKEIKKNIRVKSVVITPYTNQKSQAIVKERGEDGINLNRIEEHMSLE